MNKDQEIRYSKIERISKLLEENCKIYPKSKNGSYYDYILKHDQFYITVNNVATTLVNNSSVFWGFGIDAAKKFIETKCPQIKEKIEEILNEEDN